MCIDNQKDLAHQTSLSRNSLRRARLPGQLSEAVDGQDPGWVKDYYNNNKKKKKKNMVIQEE